MFKQAAPSRLYWAGRPAMRVVQALYWLKDLLPSDRDGVITRLKRILTDQEDGSRIRDDLKDGLPAMPTWMQTLVRELLAVPPVIDQNSCHRTKRFVANDSTKAAKRSGRPARVVDKTSLRRSRAERA
jgi:hypothetical protein